MYMKMQTTCKRRKGKKKKEKEKIKEKIKLAKSKYINQCLSQKKRHWHYI